MGLETKTMKTLQLNGSYHQKLMGVYVYTPEQHTSVVTIVIKGLYGVFDPNHACGVNILGDMLIDNSVSHVVFYNSSRDFSLTAKSNLESRKTAFIDKSFNDELFDLCTVIQYVIDHAKEDFGINQSELILYLHGTSVGGTIALMASAKFPQIKKLSLCAPPASRGNSKKPIVSSIPKSEKLFSAARRFTGDMFLLYGEQDTIVPKESSFAIINHATRAHATSLVVPKADHDFRKLDGMETPSAHQTFATAVFDFFCSRSVI